MDFEAIVSLGSDIRSLAEPGTGASWLGAAAWLLLAFMLGLVHAFDADHVMAMSVFATQRRSARSGLSAGLRWATGHGLVLLVAGVLLLVLGRSLPERVTSVSEHMIGWVMVGLGIYVWIDLARKRGHLHFHEHDGFPSHAHWHTHSDRSSTGIEHRCEGRPEGDDHVRDHREDHRHEHGPLLVGALHGLAGSAPILAVLPAAARSPLLGIGYLLLFAGGVALAMGVVSGLMGHLAGRLWLEGHSRGLSLLRALCATGSIGVGAWLAIVL